MKFNKKMIVASLSTVLGLSVVGSITGTFAWYQYNTRATVSLIGMNVAETGVLDISATSATAGFRRDLTTSDLGLTDTNLTPITWETGAVQTASTAFSGTGAASYHAYKNPNASLNRVAVDSSGTAGSYADVYQEALATDYFQFSIYLRGRTVDNVSGGLALTAEKVYLTDFVLDNVAPGLIAEGLRVAIDCYDDSTSAAPDRSYLVSKTAKAAIALSGKLDCDDDGIADRLGGYEWKADRDTVVTYGTAGRTQTTIAPSSLINTPNASTGVITDDAGKLICTTPTTADHASKITFTIWLEGWDSTSPLQKTIKHVTASTPTDGADVTSMFSDRMASVAGVGTADGSTVYYSSDNITVPMWSGENTDGAKFQLGMTFGVSSDAFKD